MNTSINKIKPFLYERSISRKGEATPLPGYFSKIKNIWMVSRGNEDVPLIKFSRGLSELMTKTEAQLERDDQDGIGMVEAMTKTSHPGERSDEDYGFLLELQTKTATKTERDDR